MQPSYIPRSPFQQTQLWDKCLWMGRKWGEVGHCQASVLKIRMCLLPAFLLPSCRPGGHRGWDGRAAGIRAPAEHEHQAPLGCANPQIQATLCHSSASHPINPLGTQMEWSLKFVLKSFFLLLPNSKVKSQKSRVQKCILGDEYKSALKPHSRYLMR